MTHKPPNIGIKLAMGVVAVLLSLFLGSAAHAQSTDTTTTTTSTPALMCDTIATNAFTGCYYDDKDFATLKMVRTDTAINFDFGTSSPNSAVGPDTFSVRWQGNFTFDASPYEFTAVTDDGMRVYVDGELILDKFYDQGATTHKVSKTLSAGVHLIKVEFYENTGDAVAKLSWAKSAAPLVCGAAATSTFTGCYYDNQDFSALKMVRNDPAINFDFGTGSPDPSIAPDTFSARWQGNFAFDTSTYEFTAVTDDGIRVYLDNELILDKFYDQSATTHKVSKTLSAGVHLVKVEYYENGGDAVAKLSWAKTTTTPPLTCGTAGTNAFTGCYYDNQDFSALTVVRTDPAVNFDFGGGSPDPSIAPDTFSARWLGNFTFDTSTYAFTVTADDGIRVFIDGTKVLDKFFDQPPTTYSFTQDLTAGIHEVSIEYYEHWGGSTAKVAWEKTTTTPPITCSTVGTDAFTGCYYDNSDFSALKLTRTDAAVNFDFGTGSPDPSIAPDTFSARWQGNFTFNGSPYEFTATTDDGMRVYIDDQLILDKFFDQPATTHKVSRTLSAGTHLVRVEYYENGGDAVAKLSWANIATSGLRIITPTNGSNISGLTEVKAVFDGRDLNTYSIDWRTEGGSYTALINDSSNTYKHNYIDFGPWNWRPDNNYPLEFRARDLANAVLGNSTITVHVNH